MKIHQHPVRRPAPSLLSALVVALVALVALAGGFTAVASPAAAEPTGGCQPVGGGPVTPAGPHNATVVVDPGSGPVWSACISFSGTISGVEALQLAGPTIPGLSPLYEPYPGQGQAVCRLLGVGNDPPDCLGKSVEFWTYHRNGVYSRGGAGGATVRDGDVEAWSFSRGRPPRGATAGTRAVPASAVSSTAPPPPPPPPPAPAGSGGAPVQPPVPAPGTPRGPDQDPGTVGAATPPAGGDGSTGTTVGSSAPVEPGGTGSQPSTTADGAEAGDQGADGAVDAGTAGGAASEERAAAAPGPDVEITSGASDESSSASVLGFAGAMALVGTAAVAVRRRRSHPPT